MKHWLNGGIGIGSSIITIAAMNAETVRVVIQIMTGAFGLGVTATTFVVGLYKARDYFRERKIKRRWKQGIK